MKAQQFVTVVLQINEPAEAAGVIQPLMDSFTEAVDLPGAKVTAVSMEDEITRVGCFEELLEQRCTDLYSDRLLEAVISTSASLGCSMLKVVDQLTYPGAMTALLQAAERDRTPSGQAAVELQAHQPTSA